MPAIIKGLRELGLAFATFNDKIRRRHQARATYAAALVFAEESARIVHVRTGTVQEAISTFKGRSTNRDVQIYRVGVRKLRLGKKEKRLARLIRKARVKMQLQGDPFYYYYLERGTSKMPAYPFLLPSFVSQKDNALIAFKSSATESVNEILGEIPK